jgi:predicted component of type VI protein secretion system
LHLLLQRKTCRSAKLVFHFANMARIVFTLEDGTEIETELDSDVITVGRHHDSIVVLPSSSVSSHHATVKRRGDSYYVQDLGTTNGTKLNGVEVEEAKLEDGDQLTFGDIPAVVLLTDPKKVIPVAAAPPVVPVPKAQSLPVASASRRVAAGRSYVRTQTTSESSGCAGFFFFVGFLLVAFVIGLHIRHSNENNGRILFMDVLKKLRDGSTDASEQSPAVPAPAPTPAATTPEPAPVPAPSMPSAPATPAPATGVMQMN